MTLWRLAYTVGIPIAMVLVLVQWILSRTVRDIHTAASRIWKILFRAAWVVGLTAGLTSVLILGYHHTFRPYPSSGRIYRYMDHGTVLYLTADERFVMDPAARVGRAGAPRPSSLAGASTYTTGH